ncbi:hypothetical protein PTKIN_Ptkin01aG0246800 [Pterospermum kingtungense]
MGTKIDTSTNNNCEPPVFRITRQNHHKIGSLLPPSRDFPKFPQHYFYDSENEVHNRMKSIKRGEMPDNLDQSIVKELIEMLDKENPIVQYNAPTSLEVEALIIGDFGDSSIGRDIVIEHKKDGLQRISELHPSFMAMQYPLLFSYEEDGYYVGIPYRNIDNNQKRKSDNVTLREYYAYRL